MAIVSAQKLDRADKNCDSLEEVISGPPNQTVTTPAGRKLVTLATIGEDIFSTDVILQDNKSQREINDALEANKVDASFVGNAVSPKADKVYVDQLVINAQNNIQNFKTESELLAFKPTIINFTGKALDTKKVWLWDGVKWDDTGLSELDQANKNIEKLGIRKSIVNAWDVIDAAGKEAIAVTGDGHFKTGTTLTVQENSQFAHILARDATGAVSAAIDKNGNFIVGNSTHKTEIAKVTHWHKADVMMVCSLGQSLSKGRNSLPVKNTAQPYFNMTFKSGEQANSYDNPDYTAFKPLVGNQLNENYGESPNIWHLNKLVEKQVANGDKAENWVFLGTAPQYGGTPFEGLNKGSKGYKEYIDQVQAAFDLCQVQNKTFVVSHNTWTQGENDYSLNTSKDAYKFEQIKLKNDIADDVMKITGQKFRPVLITYQCAAHRNYAGNRNYNSIAQAQFETANEDLEIYMACPIYHLQFHTDNVHLTSNGSQMLGYYFARVSEQVLIQQNDWQPLQPININWQGCVIDVVFNVPDGDLVFDTALVTKAANMGFDIWDKYDTNLMYDIISSVEITDKNRVRIVLNTVAPESAN